LAYCDFSLKIKLKGHHVDTTEVIEAESQVVLMTSRMHFKKWQKHWERCICVEGDYFEDDKSIPPSAKVKKMWIYASTAPYILHM
jgi:hypothetical protein